jgi:myosin heavy subunit
MTPKEELEKIAQIAEDPESVLFDHIQETESKFDESESKLNEVRDDIEDLDERLKEEAKKNLVLNLEMAKEELSDVSDKIEEQTKLMVENNRDKTKHLQICQYLETIKELLKKEDKEDYSEIIKAINKVSDRIKDPKETKIDLNPVLDQLKSFKKVIKDDRVKVELLDKQIDRIVNAVSFTGGRVSSGTFNKLGLQINPATEETLQEVKTAVEGITLDTTGLALDTTLDGIDTQLTEIKAIIGPVATLLEVDSGDSTIKYIGKAFPGTATSAASWQIKRMTKSATGLVIDFADGSSVAGQVWDDRESLSYS